MSATQERKVANSSGVRAAKRGPGSKRTRKGLRSSAVSRAVRDSDERPNALRLYKSVDISDSGRIAKACLFLQASAKSTSMFTSEVKLDPAMVAFARSLFDQNREYRFRMTTSTPLASSGGGVLAGTVSISPSISSFPEWNSLSNLFDEVKLEWSKIKIVSRLTPASASLGGTLVVSFDANNSNNTPASFAVAYRFPGAKVLPLVQLGVPEVSNVVHVAHREWAVVTTPAPLSPPAGLAGQWQYQTTATVSNSITYGDLICDVMIKLRNRA